MAILSVAAATGFSQVGMVAVATTATTVGGSVQLFFLNLFMNPGQGYVGVIALGAVVVLGVTGLAFLIKLLYDRCRAKPPPYNPVEGMIQMTEVTPDLRDSSSSDEED